MNKKLIRKYFRTNYQIVNKKNSNFWDHDGDWPIFYDINKKDEDETIFHTTFRDFGYFVGVMIYPNSEVIFRKNKHVIHSEFIGDFFKKNESSTFPENLKRFFIYHDYCDEMIIKSKNIHSYFHYDMKEPEIYTYQIQKVIRDMEYFINPDTARKIKNKFGYRDIKEITDIRKLFIIAKLFYR